jgi:hypothetical protein
MRTGCTLELGKTLRIEGREALAYWCAFAEECTFDHAKCRFCEAPCIDCSWLVVSQVKAPLNLDILQQHAFRDVRRQTGRIETGLDLNNVHVSSLALSFRERG